MDVPGRRPSPYSLQPLDPPARPSSPDLKSVPPRERLSPPIGESSQYIPGSGARGYALPRDASPVQPQQNPAMSYTPAASRYELEIRKKMPESPYTSQLHAIGDRDSPHYSDRFSNDGPVGHDVVELHEADQFFGFSQPPQAIQSMVKMVSMLNFMKVRFQFHVLLIKGRIALQWIQSFFICVQRQKRVSIRTYFIAKQVLNWVGFLFSYIHRTYCCASR